MQAKIIKQRQSLDDLISVKIHIYIYMETLNNYSLSGKNFKYGERLMLFG
jgi:hypothetical protein